MSPSQPYYTDASIRAVDVSLNYRSWHTETASQPYKTDLLLLHGLGSTLHIWDRVVPYLMNHIAGQVVALDQRGHGRSDKPDGGYTTDQIVEDDHAVAQALGLAQPIIIGHSWGTTIAMAYAIAHPEATRALILVDGVFGNLKDQFGPTWEDALKHFNIPDGTGIPKAHFLQRYLGKSQGRFFAPIWNDELEQIVLSTVQPGEDGTVVPRLNRAHDLKLMRTLWETSHIDMVRRITQPVLMIAAEHEPAPGDDEASQWIQFRREGSARMLKVFPDPSRVRHVVMPDSVHDVPLQRPQELGRIILDFVRDVLS
jgi:pimeloyl-ACP methyl ester carboxylesterase